MYDCYTIFQNKPYPFQDITTVGRYKVTIDEKQYKCDVIFGFNDLTACETIGRQTSNNGYYPGWTYDLDCLEMRDIVMEWIEMLDVKERTLRNVIRHIMYCMSYDNVGDRGLIVGRWGINYNDEGKSPTHWKTSSQIFKERYTTGKAIRYGQCWCFAECLTSIFRFLGIPTRTIMGRNTLIDENQDFGIDFTSESTKDDDDKWNLIERSNLDLSIHQMTHSIVEKSSSWDPKKIYQAGDSYWNNHFWNEIYIPISDDNYELFSWEVVDSTPVIASKSLDSYIGIKIAGPCKISSFRSDEVTLISYSPKISKSPILKENLLNNNYDFDHIFAMTNSPFRLWAIEPYISGDKIINIPYVYSIIFPFSKKLSCYINTKKNNQLFSLAPCIFTKKFTDKNFSLEDLTSRYQGDNEKIKRMYYNKIAKMTGNVYIQIVYLDSLGNVINIERRFTTINNEILNSNVENIRISYPTCYLVSYLLIEDFDGNFNDDSEFLTSLSSGKSEDLNVDESDTSNTICNWATFCEYTQRGQIR